MPRTNEKVKSPKESTAKFDRALEAFKKLSRIGSRSRMRNDLKGKLYHYSIPLLIVTGVVLLKNTLTIASPIHMPMQFSMLATAFTFFLAGTGPAVFSIALSSVATAYFFLDPIHSFSVSRASDIYGLFFSALEGIALVVLMRTTTNDYQENEAILQVPEEDENINGVRWLPYLLATALIAGSMITSSLVPNRIIKSFGENSRWVNHAFQARNEIRDVIEAVRAVELEVSEFSRTGTMDARENIKKALQKIPSEIRDVEAVEANNPERTKRTQAIQLEFVRLKALLESSMRMGQHLSLPLVKASSNTLIAESQMMFDEETKLLTLHQSQASYQTKMSVALAAGVTSVVAFLVICILLFLYFDAIRRFRLERELLTARRSADLANRAKGDFLANISHEIRTPLNGIIGMLSLLRATNLDEKQKGYSSAIKKSAAILLSLINDILDFSKIEAGKLDIELVDFKFHDFLEDIRECFSPLFEEKGLRFSIICAVPADCHFKSDPSRIRQIINNLLSNALKFTKQGEVTLRAEVKELSDGQPNIYFSVADSGIGISSEAVGRLFKPFSQGDASTSRTYGGTGLGLAISKRLAEIMGGRISVNSVPGRGSIFQFHIQANRSALPLLPGDATAAQTQQVGLSPESRAGFTVLVAEDNLINQEITKSILENAGYKCLVVSNGLEAIDLSHRVPIQAIVMDCHMPELDGYEATKRLRAQGSRIPIVALTAKAFKEDQQKCLNAGMNSYLSKPINENQLLGCLDGLLTEGHPPEKSHFLPGHELEAIDHLPVLDPSLIHNLQSLDQGKTNLVQRLVKMYFDTIATEVEILKRGVSEGSSDVPSRAHSLKSSNANLGAKRVVRILEQIEYGERSDLTTAITELESEVKKFCAELRQFESNLDSQTSN